MRFEFPFSLDERSDISKKKNCHSVPFLYIYQPGNTQGEAEQKVKTIRKKGKKLVLQSTN